MPLSGHPESPHNGARAPFGCLDSTSRTTVEHMGIDDKRPIGFFDVDGVLSPYGTPPDTWVTWEPIPHTGFRAEFSPEMLTAVFGLNVEHRWLSTWEELTERINGWGGVPEGIPYIRRAQPEGTGLGWWKAEHVSHALRTTERRAVWVDDEIGKHQDAATRTLRQSDRVLIIAPDRNVGLTPDHIDQIATWVAQN